MKPKIAALCLAFAVPAAPAAAQPAAAAEDDILSRIISNPNPQSYRLDGIRSGGGVRRDESVQGGRALRVPVPGRSEQAWAVSVAVPITRAVQAGDNLVLAFWARLERGDNGATTATLPYNAVQLASAPYTALFTGPATVGPEWQLHEVRGRADRAYQAGELNVSLHLASGRHTIDIGPVFVLNMGQTGR